MYTCTQSRQISRTLHSASACFNMLNGQHSLVMRVMIQLSALQRLRKVQPCLGLIQPNLVSCLHTSQQVQLSLVQSSTLNCVTTLTMNNPAKCNRWSVDMLDMLYHKLDMCAKDDSTKVIILTGADPYYSSGGDISGYMKLQWAGNRRGGHLCCPV